MILASLIGLSLLKAESAVHRTTIDEQFFGSNSTSYAVIRSEIEFDAITKKNRQKTWLDEYSKESVLIYKFPKKEDRIRNGAYTSKLVKSTLLLDVTFDQQTIGHASSLPPKTANIARPLNSTTSISSLLLRYPTRKLIDWPLKQRSELRYNDSSFFIS